MHPAAGILVLAGTAAGLALLLRELLNPAVNRAAAAAGFTIRRPQPFSGAVDFPCDFAIGRIANTTRAEVRLYPDGIGIVHEGDEFFVHHTMVEVAPGSEHSGAEPDIVARASGKRLSFTNSRACSHLAGLIQAAAARP